MPIQFNTDAAPRISRQLAIAALVTWSVTGCIMRDSDFSHSLAGDYELVQTSAHQVVIVPKNGWSNDSPTIPSKVVEVAFDDRFILAKRQYLKRRRISPSDGYEEPIAGEFDYWILDTRGPTVSGPFDEAEFAVNRKELSISDQLQMQATSSLHPSRQRQQ
jgi:hypothetical protein